MALTQVTSAGLKDGEIVNADLHSAAQVALAKLEVITSNRIVGNDSGNAVPKELTPAEVRTIINVEDGATADQTASEILTLIKTVDGSGSGLDADLLDGSTGADYLNASNLSSGSVPAARLDTATTQSAGNNSTKIATTAFVSTAVTNLIGGAPGALDTLNELAAAINDDSSYASTVTTALATKAPKSNPIFTGNDFGFGATPGGTPASKNIFLAIGDSDTGIVQDGDGQLELWANATEVANINAIDGYTSVKPITTTGTITGNLFSGSGASLTALNASNISSGTINTNRFGNSTISRVHIQDNAINGDKIADSSITSAKILNDSIVNADIKSDAAIALSKLASTPAVLTGSTNNTITTVTAANTIQGEANLTFDGTDLLPATGESQNLGGASNRWKRLYLGQGGELIFGDSTTSNFFGITEGLQNNFSDQDKLSLYFRSELNFYSSSNTHRTKIDSSGNITLVTGNLYGNTSNTTEIGSFASPVGAIKRIRMTQGGEIHFGDTTTSNFLGITEGAVDNFTDQDRLGIYYRNELKFYSNNNNERLRLTSDGLVIWAGHTLSARNSATGVSGGMIYNTDAKVFQYYDGSGWQTITSNSQIVATGGSSVSTQSGYRIHDFQSNGTFEITSGVGEVEILVVGGGGSEGGASSGCHAGGGGGGGGVVYQKRILYPGKYNVVVGAGGNWRNNGSNSVFGNNWAHSTIYAFGGGAGGPTLSGDGNDGGSGGGGSRHDNNNQGGTGYQPTRADGGFGHDGGHTGPSNTNPGGGGGAGGAGQNGNNGGAGGAGLQFTQFGVNIYFGAGGSSGGNNHGAGNTGAGAGGSNGGGTRYSGGSGRVMVRYPAAS